MQVEINEIIIKITLNIKDHIGIFVSAGAFSLKTKNKTYYFDADTSWAINDAGNITIHLSDIIDPNTDDYILFNEEDLHNIIKFEDFYIYFENNNDLRVQSIDYFEMTTLNESIIIDQKILDKCLKETLCYEIVDNMHEQSYVHEGVN